MKDETVIPFHKRLCERCHAIPGAEKWMKDSFRDDISHITEIGKRMWNYERWEPIFIGTNMEPLYDERLSWEGRQDKMTQVISQKKQFTILITETSCWHELRVELVYG